MHACMVIINYTIERKMGPCTMLRGQGGAYLTGNDVDFLLVSLDQDFYILYIQFVFYLVLPTT